MNGTPTRRDRHALRMSYHLASWPALSQRSEAASGNKAQENMAA
jgi:hypothetical protein